MSLFLSTQLEGSIAWRKEEEEEEGTCCTVTIAMSMPLHVVSVFSQMYVSMRDEERIKKEASKVI